ncbi:MAG: hypothetical protein IJY78_03740 [Bacteroidaceae bacterium]|nr:hypothetical protein [Bacteroidaceae bacterium]
MAALLVAGGLAQSAWGQEPGTYYIQNVSNGKWLGPYNSWGTQASVLDHADYWKLAKISDGVYTLESVVSNGGSSHYLSGTYCDGAATNLHFTPVDGKENTYNISTAEGSAFLVNSTGTIVDNTGTDGTNLAAQWKLYSEDDMTALLNSADVENPVDATYLIKDHNVGRNNRDYKAGAAWVKTGGAKDPTSSGSINGESVFSIESWKAAFDVNQTLANIPNGVYSLRVNGFYRVEASGGEPPYLYANDDNVTLPIVTGGENSMQSAALSFVAGKYLSDPVYVQVTDGTLKIGVKADGDTFWTIFKNFHLYYYGDVTKAEVVLADYVKAYKEAWNDASSYLDTSMFDEDKVALNAALVDNELDLSSNLTADDLTTATKELADAAAAAKLASTHYANYAKATSLIEEGADAATVDLTSLIVNPSFEDGTNGWTNSGSIPATTQSNNSFAGKKGTYYAERWHTSGTIDINQTVAKLPAGIYKVSASMYSDVPDAKLYVNGEATSVSATKIYEAFIEISDKEALKFGASCSLTDKTWICVDDFSLAYVNELPAYTLVEGKMETAVADAQSAAETAYINDKTLANYKALLTAISNADVSAQAYKSAKDAIDRAGDLLVNNNFVTSETFATFADAIAGAKEKYENDAYSTEEAKNVGLTLGTSVSGWRANANAPAVAFMESAWDNSNDWSDYYVNTWSTEGETDGSGFVVPFFEYYVANGSLAKRVMTGTMEGLTPNQYCKVVMDVRTVGTVSADSIITLSIVGGEPVNITTGAQIGTTGRYLGTFSAYGYSDENGVLTVQINVPANSGISWLSWRNIRYEEVTDLAAEAKEALLSVVESVAKLNTTINVGDGVFEIPTSAVASLTEEVKVAVAICESKDVTVEEVEAEIVKLNAAIEAYKNVELNAPAENTRYNLILNYEGWTYDNKAVTFIHDGRNDHGLYNIQYLVEPNPNYAQAIIFTKAEGLNRYTMSIMDVDGKQRYVCTGVTYGGNTGQIRTTTDASKALVVEIRITNVDGNFNIYNTEANNYIGSQDAGVFTVNSHIDFNIAEAVEAEVELKI